MKRNFTGGKMNKDLDERLVPRGEYRDAMNIQVSTSETSKVGNIQNIQGNALGCSNWLYSTPIPVGSTTVGSISDEKNDQLYWMIAGGVNAQIPLVADSNGDYHPQSIKDMIVRKNPSDIASSTCEAVFVDKYGFIVHNIDTSAGTSFSLYDEVNEIGDPTLYDEITEGMTVAGFTSTGQLSFPATIVEGSGTIPLPQITIQYSSQAVDGPQTTLGNDDDDDVTGQYGDIMSVKLRTFDASTSFVTSGSTWLPFETIWAEPNRYNLMTADLGPLSGIQTNAIPPAGHVQVWFPLSQPLPSNLIVGAQIDQTGGWLVGEVTDISVVVLHNDMNMQSIPGTLNSESEQVNLITIAPNQDINDPYTNATSNIPTTVYNTVFPLQTSSMASGNTWLNPQPFTSEMNYYEEFTMRVRQPFGIAQVPGTATTVTQVPNNLILVSSLSQLSVATIYSYTSQSPTVPVEVVASEGSAWGQTLYNPACVDPATLSGPNDITFTIVSCQELYSPFYQSNVPLTGQAINPTSFGTTMSFQPKGTTQGVWLEESVDLSNTHTLRFDNERVLNFDKDRLITGINILDDMLFWTDNFSEPKKININRSIQGTDQDGDTHTITKLPKPKQGKESSSYRDAGPTKLEHITVIKKHPSQAPTITMSRFREGLFSTGDELKAYNAAYEPDANGVPTSSVINETFFTNKVKEDNVWFFVDSINNIFPSFEIGDVLNLSADYADFTEDDDDKDIKVIVKEVANGPADQSSYPSWDIPIQTITTGYLVEILFISESGESAKNQIAEWHVSLDTTASTNLFERKFPRFAYRYKYADNEYSSFSPWSEVAFLPGAFSYEPVKAYNEGMVNTVSSLLVEDFAPTPSLGSNTLDPIDIVQIDLLYKNETSPVIYLMDSFTKYDSVGDSGINAWNSLGSGGWIDSGPRGSYKVTTESIYAALPENQSLRVWDNVPKKALAQEITANRIVYGNYSQGYDLISPGGNKTQLIPKVNVAIEERTQLEGEVLLIAPKKSIKSLRSYVLGVVWGDKFGRETPVITPLNASISVPKSKADSSNAIEVSLDKSPAWADYYKFYIKETSNEYYNLAADRVYEAEDGNWWVSFPSVDRNKLDEDTYIILKKGINSNSLAAGENRYKVVAIENEAPEYIKTTFSKIATTPSDSSRPENSFNLFGGSGALGVGNNTLGGGRSAPAKGKSFFTLDYNHWSGDYNDSTNDAAATFAQMQLMSPVKMIEEVNANSSEDEMYVSFSRRIKDDTTSDTVSTVGLKYKVISATLEEDSNDDFYVINLNSPLLHEDKFVAEGIQSGDDNIHITFWKKSVLNKPEFDGRFFAKIYSDSADFKNKLQNQYMEERDWRVTASLDLFKIEDSGLSDNIVTATGTAFSKHDGTTAFQTQTLADWTNRLKFGNTSLEYGTSRWFIDKASFAGIQGGNNDYNNSIATLDFKNPTVSYDLSDITSSVDWDETAPSQDAWWAQTLGTYTDSIGTGESLNQIGMKGVHTVNGHHYVDMSYSMLPPTGHTNPKFGSTTSRRQLNWEVGEGEMDSEKLVVNGLQKNKLFRFTESNQIYKILGVRKFRLYNYQGKNTAQHASRKVNPPGLVAAATYWHSEHERQHPLMVFQRNRRHTYRVRYEIDSINSPSGTDSDAPLTDFISSLPTNNASINMQFLTEFRVDGENEISTNPAIFETEPKEDVDLNLYYEASSSIPTFPITNRNKYSYIPIGSTLVQPTDGDFPEGIYVSSWGEILPNQLVSINFSDSLTRGQFKDLKEQDYVKFLRDNGSYSTAKIIDFPESFPNVEVNGEWVISSVNIVSNSKMGLSWHNCWAFGNGVESNRIGDTFNKPFLSNGVTVSSSLDRSYKEEHRKYGLIYSGIYNSNSGTNNLNQFIAGEKITKDINPIYGSIQKLYSRSTADGDLITLCEDRVLRVLSDKDALFNADGNMQLTSTNNVLGKAIPYSGDYGISTNPESFAAESYRVYFTDKVRGTVMRLSKDGLTPISDFGMKNWFRDNLKLSNRLVGSYDERKKEYNITLKGINKTVSFKEDVRGWVSFKSFIPENAISCANQYYSFNNGTLWKHNVNFDTIMNVVDRNTFYKNHGGFFEASSLKFILNDSPGVVKTFHTLNYEGSQSQIIEQQTYETNTLSSFTGFNAITGGSEFSVADTSYFDKDYYNDSSKLGWHVKSIRTNLEAGSLNEFIKKEGKWFNYIKGNSANVASSQGDISGNLDTSDISFQGLGIIENFPTILSTFGCTDASAFNYNASAGSDDGSCMPVVNGCTDANSFSYDPLANTDDGSCVYLGCTDPSADNYDPNAVSDSGNCIFLNIGCTDNTFFQYQGNTGAMVNVPYFQNFDPTASVSCNDDNSACFNGQNGENCCCEPTVVGCLDVSAANYDSSANYQPVIYDSSVSGYVDVICNYSTAGCTDPLACNYSISANPDDGSCYYCSSSAANAYNSDGNPAGCNSGCIYCEEVQNISASAIDTMITLTWTNPTGPFVAPQSGINISYRPSSAPPGTEISVLATALSTTYTLSNLDQGTDYLINIQTECGSSAVVSLPDLTDANINPFIISTTGTANVFGCNDVYADNYDSNVTAGAVYNDGSCSITACLDPTASNCGYNQAGFYVPIIQDVCNNNGDFVAGSNSYNGNWVDGTSSICNYPVVTPGCTQPGATNYNPNATIDDGFCVWMGCWDTFATNTDVEPTGSYNSATLNNGLEDDGSCLYTYTLPIQSVAHTNSSYGRYFFVDDGSNGVGMRNIIREENPTLSNFHEDAHYFSSFGAATVGGDFVMIEKKAYNVKNWGPNHPDASPSDYGSGSIPVAFGRFNPWAQSATGDWNTSGFVASDVVGIVHNTHKTSSEIGKYGYFNMSTIDRVWDDNGITPLSTNTAAIILMSQYRQIGNQNGDPSWVHVKTTHMTFWNSNDANSYTGNSAKDDLIHDLPGHCRYSSGADAGDFLPGDILIKNNNLHEQQ